MCSTFSVTTNQALKESLAVGKFSPDRQRHHSDGFLSGLRSPSIDSARGGGNVPGNVPGSPASIVSIGSVGSASRCSIQYCTLEGSGVQHTFRLEYCVRAQGMHKVDITIRKASSP